MPKFCLPFYSEELRGTYFRQVQWQDKATAAAVRAAAATAPTSVAGSGAATEPAAAAPSWPGGNGVEPGAATLQLLLLLLLLQLPESCSKGRQWDESISAAVEFNVSFI